MQLPEKDTTHVLEAIAPEYLVSDQRREVLLAKNPAWNAPIADSVARHTMHFVVRVLQSWPRMMATHDTRHLPPIIHRLQLAKGMPGPLANCYTLAKMWIGHTPGSRDLVQRTIQDEVRRLLREYSSYDAPDLLAAAQSLLILLIILLFGFGNSAALAHPVDAQLLIDMWDVKQALAMTGLFLEQESNHTLPRWRDWAMVSAKRRTILALHHLEWAWSLRHGYPILTCLELGPLPAPAARYLWEEGDERSWEHQYNEWLRLWRGGSYRMEEFFQLNAGDSANPLDERSEMWLADADGFGVMLMAEGIAPRNLQ
ncbi:hypothetical protein GQ53DRAFT_827992 [Thozetella sp. PMI_491]|nr:hypothetical protein GQ53DRAFT_827992 [Thozetella sp. PMI_491]